MPEKSNGICGQVFFTVQCPHSYRQSSMQNALVPWDDSYTFST